tara:strand:+ start:249 stop:374 length:126 start_codon:yes stop_codon:yes gene_type:complete
VALEAEVVLSLMLQVEQEILHQLVHLKVILEGLEEMVLPLL